MQFLPPGRMGTITHPHLDVAKLHALAQSHGLELVWRSVRPHELLTRVTVNEATVSVRTVSQKNRNICLSLSVITRVSQWSVSDLSTCHYKS